MKTMIVAALLAMTVSGTAMAQTHREPVRQQTQSLRSPVAQQASSPHTSTRVAVKPTNHTPPRHWKKSRASYQAHATACQRRYKSYNPRTDAYSLGKGRITTCRL